MGAIKHIKTFEKLLINSDDQLTVRILLVGQVPKDIQSKIVKRYNELVTQHNDKITDKQRSSGDI